MHLETDVLVVGGGCTGTGVARDLALRGLRVVLAEREDIASGTSGRNHGLLHSGGRYAVKDPEAATECISENRILRKIAGHCVWDSGGLFVLLADDDPVYADQLLAACQRIGIPAVELSPDEVREQEPGLAPSATKAIRVPDGTIDPFSLCLANAVDAAERGGTVLIHHELARFEVAGGGIKRAVLKHSLDGTEVTVEPRLVINAAGCWSGKVAALAGIDLNLILSKGSLLVTSARLVRGVVNRCRLPASGDILVPGGPVTLLGTTSITTDDPSDRSTSAAEIELLRQEAEQLVSGAGDARVLRAFAGVRPLYQEAGPEGDGRAVTRGHAVIDHATRDGLSGLISIVGGKLTTYRKMAEDVVDLACAQLGVDAPCTTSEVPLPGSEEIEAAKPKLKVPGRTLRMAGVRHGCRAEKTLEEGAGGDEERLGHVCLCESVTEAEVRYAVDRLWAKTVDDVRRRTRVGCGPCQGTYCGPRVASVVAEALEVDGDASSEGRLEASFAEERGRGKRPSMKGAQIVQEALHEALWQASGLTTDEGVDDES